MEGEEDNSVFLPGCHGYVCYSVIYQKRKADSGPLPNAVLNPEIWQRKVKNCP